MKRRTVKFSTDEDIIEALDCHRSRHVTRTELIEWAIVRYLRYLALKDGTSEGGAP